MIHDLFFKTDPVRAYSEYRNLVPELPVSDFCKKWINVHIVVNLYHTDRPRSQVI